MTTLQDRREAPWVVLVVGLFMVLALSYAAIVSSGVHPVLGVVVGVVELVLARGLGATRSTRVLRWLLAIFGTVTIALSVFFWVI